MAAEDLAISIIAGTVAGYLPGRWNRLLMRLNALVFGLMGFGRAAGLVHG